MKITVLGAGNAGCAMAAHMTLQGHEVRLYNRWENEIEVLKEKGGIHLKGCLGDKFVPLSLVTTDIEQAMDGTEFVAVVVPTTAHDYFAELIAPHLKPHMPVLLNPGHTAGALRFRQVLKEKDAPDVDLCETNTNIYIARLTGPAEVTVWNCGGVYLAALPASRLDNLMTIISKLVPTAKPVDTVFDTSFANINAIMHPTVMILNSGWIEAGPGFRFYAEGATESVCKVMAEVERERMAVMKAMGLKPVSFNEVFFHYGATSERALKSGSVFDALQDSEPNKPILAPNSMKHRFLDEDIPNGFVPMEALGKLVEVKTPTITSLIDLACLINDKDYRETGLTLDKLGLSGMTLDEIMAYVTQ